MPASCQIDADFAVFGLAQGQMAVTSPQTGFDRGDGLDERIGLKSYWQSNPPVG